MKPRSSFSGLLLLLMVAPSLMAQSVDWPAPNWQRERALQHAAQPGSEQVFRDLMQAWRGGSQMLTSQLTSLKSGNAVSSPEREAGLVRFLQQIQSNAQGRLSVEALSLLKNWQAQTLVAHEESASIGTPLFPIAAMAQGLEQRWRREDFRGVGNHALKQSATDWITLWEQNTDSVARDGLLDAVQEAAPNQQRELVRQAMAKRADAPSLMRVVIAAALALRDVALMEGLLEVATDAQARSLLDAIAGEGSRDERYGVLATLCQRPSTHQAALAIAILTPQLTQHAATERLLLQLMSDPALGSSAALALMRDPSIAARQQVEAFAASVDPSLRAQRARLAIQLRAHRETTP